MAFITAEFSFRDQLILNLAGPLSAAILVGIIANWITARAQRRRDNHTLRERLVNDVLRTADALYWSTQLYSRAKRDGSTSDLRPLREALDRQYHESKMVGRVMERVLDLHFKDELPERLCHRAVDLLTVRYYQLVCDGRPPDHIVEAIAQNYSGDRHTGLNGDELWDGGRVLATYIETEERLANAIITAKLRSVRRKRPERHDGPPRPRLDHVRPPGVRLDRII